MSVIKKLLLASMAIFLLLPTIGYACQISETSGGELLVDDATGEYWQAVLTRYSGTNYSGTIQQIALDKASTYGLISTWELATNEQIADLFTSIESVELAQLLEAIGGEVTADVITWKGRENIQPEGDSLAVTVWVVVIWFFVDGSLHSFIF